MCRGCNTKHSREGVTPDGNTLVLPNVGVFDAVTGQERRGFASEDKGWLVPVISPNNKLLLVSTNGSYEIGNHRLFLIELWPA
jgi:hypothetical protein